VPAEAAKIYIPKKANKNLSQFLVFVLKVGLKKIVKGHDIQYFR